MFNGKGLAVDLKREMLRLLDEDEEFRYAVAGRIGLLEVLRRLDKLEEGQRNLLESVAKLWENQNKLWDSHNKLWEEVRGLREGQNMLWEEVRSLREDQNKLWEGQNKLWEEVRSLREGQNKLWEEVRSLREGQNKLWESNNKLWEEVRSLRDGMNKLWEGQNKLWEGQNKLWEEVRDIRITLNRVSVTLERLTISVEEEALSFIKHRLKTDLGVDIDLERIFVDSKEINIYGAVEDLCVVGEAAVRLGTALVDEVVDKLSLMKAKRPDLLRKRVVKVIYTDYATPDALKRAAENNVWVLKWSGDLTPLRIEQA
ncbi:MAG: hypothetical protein RMK31_07735 [Candidatus Caldarchaeum sp.]|nr:hypothetical protein [Candidatus Caldarchaeum sp.]MDW8360452.1 hypothetical protein [Candidatus Caldarchaeum sp.]